LSSYEAAPNKDPSEEKKGSKVDFVHGLGLTDGGILFW